MKKSNKKRKTLQRKTDFKKRTRRPTKKPSELKRNKTWCIYGRSGHGKTTLAGTFPKPIILIDCKDEGTESVTDNEVDEVYEVGSVEEIEDAYWYCQELAERGRIGTVVIDTTTAMQRIVIEEVGGKRAAASGKKAGDWGTMKQKDWGKVSGIMTDLITRFKDLDCETVFLAQEKVFDPSDSDDDTEGEVLPEVGPANMKSVAAHICASSSFIGHVFVRMVEVKIKMKKRRRPEYCIRVGPNPVYITKVRKPRSIELPDFVSDPTFKKLQQLKTGKTK